MARRSGRITTAERDNFYITSLLHPPFKFGLPSVLRVFEDRREFHPDGYYRRAGRFSGLYQSTVVAMPSSSRSGRRDTFRFNVPDKVAICVRRKARREVLFAFDKVRSGSGASRRRNYYSDVSCKR